MPSGWVMEARPLYSEASPSLSLVGMVNEPRVMLSCRRGPCIKVDDNLMRFSGRNRFSRISLKWAASTVGKRVWREVTAGGSGSELPMASAGLGAGAEC